MTKIEFLEIPEDAGQACNPELEPCGKPSAGFYITDAAGDIVGGPYCSRRCATIASAPAPREPRAFLP